MSSKTSLDNKESLNVNYFPIALKARGLHMQKQVNISVWCNPAHIMVNSSQQSICLVKAKDKLLMKLEGQLGCLISQD